MIARTPLLGPAQRHAQEPPHRKILRRVAQRCKYGPLPVGAAARSPQAQRQAALAEHGQERGGGLQIAAARIVPQHRALPQQCRQLMGPGQSLTARQTVNGGFISGV